MVFVVPGSRAAVARAPCVAMVAACLLCCCFQYHNKLHGSTFTRHALRQMAASLLFVCPPFCGEAAVRENKLFTANPASRAGKTQLKGILVGAESCLCRWEIAQASSGSSHQGEYCDLVPVTQLSYQCNGKQCSPESCTDGQQPISISVNAEVSHSKLFECSLECSYVQQLPLEPPSRPPPC